VVWTIPSPWRVRALGAARLVSTPSRRPFSRSAWLGIACYRFPRIWAVLHNARLRPECGFDQTQLLCSPLVNVRGALAVAYCLTCRFA
jgi:hypothetical protein